MIQTLIKLHVITVGNLIIRLTKICAGGCVDKPQCYHSKQNEGSGIKPHHHLATEHTP